MNISPSVLGLIRGLGYPLLAVLLAYFSVVEHVTSLGISAGTAIVIVGFISSIEHFLAARSTDGKALFGAVYVK